jgi:methionine-rich copper-binding protein CopC
MTGRRLGGGLAAVVLALLLGVLTAAPAAAHNQLRGSDPADGATVTRTPGAVVLTFDQPAVALGTQVVVTGPDGTASTGAAELVDATVRQPLVPGAPGGAYTVVWRITSSDGHPITGELTFTSGAAGAGTYPGPAEPPAPVDPGGAPAWSWLLLAALLLGAAAVLAVLRRRRSHPQD